MPAACLGDVPLNVVLLMLDDMRYDQVAVMPEVAARTDALRFSYAYFGTPLCSPMRAGLLSGGFPPAETGVRTNDPPTGGVSAFRDTDTLPVRLQAAGYSTGLVGKYLNGYASLGAYVPPGWTAWAAWLGGDDWSRYRLVEGSSGATASEGVRVDHDTYITDLQGEWAERFIGAHRDTPFFLDIAFVAPHDPHVPAAEDVGAYADYVYRGGAYEEADVTDKPAWIQALPLLTFEEQAAADTADRERQETLLAVDRAITRIGAALDTYGVADRTVVFLVSDNGELWGEHRVFDKGVAYQEAVHAPVLVWGPGVHPGESPELVDPVLDVGATIQSIAGLTPHTEGVDLTPVLCGGAGAGRDHVLVQDWSREEESWSGLVTPRYTYVEWASGERELYDRDADPSEVSSLHADPAAAPLLATFGAMVAAERGLGGGSGSLPAGVVGRPYTQVLEAWGGTPPLTWTQIGGNVPQGVTLAADGTLAGSPRGDGDFAFAVRIEDSSTSPVTGLPQSVTAKLSLRIDAAPLDTGPGDTAADAAGGEGCQCGATDAAPFSRLTLIAALLALVSRRRSRAR